MLQDCEFQVFGKRHIKGQSNAVIQKSLNLFANNRLEAFFVAALILPHNIHIEQSLYR